MRIPRKNLTPFLSATAVVDDKQILWQGVNGYASRAHSGPAPGFNFLPAEGSA